MAIVGSIDDAVDKLDNLSAISTPNMKGNAVLRIVSLNWKTLLNGITEAARTPCPVSYEFYYSKDIVWDQGLSRFSGISLFFWERHR